MKFLHSADWHLGNTFHGHSRSTEHAHFLAWLLDEVRQQQPDALLLTGDIFDSPNPPAAAERQFYDFLTAATEAVQGLQIVATAGNHDSGGRLEAPAELLRRSNVYVRGLVRRDPDTDEVLFDHYILPLSTLANSEARVVVFALPYLRPTDYPAGLTQTEGIAWFIDNLTKRLRKSDFRGLPVVIAAHFYAAGVEVCENEHSERLIVGGQECVDATRVTRDASYVALGHIHKAQPVRAANVPMHYAGSVLPMSFTEKDYNHGVNLVEIDEAGEATTRRIPYEPLRRLVSVPAAGALSPDEALAALADLPKREKHNAGDDWPYLEIRIFEEQPQPALMHDVAVALADRAVHFCRMVREVPTSVRAKSAEAPTTLRTLNPTEMAARLYEKRYNAPMTEALRTRLEQAIAAAQEEENEKQ